MAGALTFTGFSPNVLYAGLIYIATAQTVVAIATRINTASSGNSIELGIYSNSNGVPVSLLLDSGSISATIAGLKQVTGLSTALTPGWYWLAYGANASITMNGINTGPASGTPNQGIADLEVARTPYTGVTGSWTFSAGNLPATFPTSTPLSGILPVVAIKF
jgi:hypothetical protein